MLTKSIIVAVDRNGAIGKDNRLLWHIGGDLRNFKKVTMGCPVIMGRRTWESIGRALPGRLNIVVTSSDTPLPEGVLRVRSLQDAFAAAQDNSGPGGECFVIGGGSLYAAAMPFADKLYVTRIHATAEDADTFFPVIDPEKFTRESISEKYSDGENNIEYSFEILRRK